MPKTSSRLLTLLSMLQARRDWSGAVLADRLDVSARTVRRDIDRLRELGYRIDTFKGPDGGYRLDAGADLPPLLFDDEQALALAISLQVTAVSGAGLGEGTREAAVRALTTLRQVMPSRLRHRWDAVPITVVQPPESRSSDADSEVLMALGAAVHAQVELRFDYETPSGGRHDRPPRRVEPHHLVTWRGRWYLVAWDLEREDWRTYRADRVAPRTPTGPRFAPREFPGGDVATWLVARFRGQDGAHPTTDWPCTGTVVLEMPVHEVRPFTTGVAEEHDERRTRLTEGSWSWSALAASLLRYDVALEVVEPAELRIAFAALADRCAAVAR